MTRTKQAGFTLVELMLAMAFVTFMLVFMMAALVHLTRIYNKGLSIRQMNQSGRQLNDDFARTARFASSATIKTGTQRICVNGVTYAWNTGDPTVSPVNKFVSGSRVLTFVRVDDAAGALCSGGDIPISAKDLLPLGLYVQRIDLTLSVPDNNKIATLHTFISTGGQSAPTLGSGGTYDFNCPSGLEGAFCAFAEYETTVYIRN